MDAPRIVILGGGESGWGSALLARRQGFDVFLSDSGSLAPRYREALEKEGVPFEEGGHLAVYEMGAAEVIKSPGIPETAAVVRHFTERGVPVISEIEFAGRYSAGRTICITGSNGKTTTATLVYEILKAAGYDVALTGNIGDSYAAQVAKRDRQWYVLELSSFQLDGMFTFRPHIAALLNITPDHLDRYGYDMDRYIDSKMRITDNQTANDSFIYFAGDRNIAAGMERKQVGAQKIPFSTDKTCADVGAWIEGGEIIARYGGRECVIGTEKLQIAGTHNHYNVMAAALMAMAAGVPGVVIEETVKNFGGVPHRMEYTGTVDGVKFVNDSKATNTDAAWYALNGTPGPIVWIAGGTDKGNDYAPLVSEAAGKVKALVCMGVDNSKLVESFTGVVGQVFDTASLDKAMEAAVSAADGGDTVLLSPACASFDLFRNYEHRGDMFKEWVRARMEKTKQG